MRTVSLLARSTLKNFTRQPSWSDEKHEGEDAPDRSQSKAQNGLYYSPETVKFSPRLDALFLCAAPSITSGNEVRRQANYSDRATPTKAYHLFKAIYDQRPIVIESFQPTAEETSVLYYFVLSSFYPPLSSYLDDTGFKGNKERSRSIDVHLILVTECNLFRALCP